MPSNNGMFNDANEFRENEDYAELLVFKNEFFVLESLFMVLILQY